MHCNLSFPRTLFLSIKRKRKFLPELRWWLIADKGRGAQEWGMQSSCPRCYSWAAKRFLSSWVSAYKWKSSPPDKPAAPAGGAELRSSGKRGWAPRQEEVLQGGGSRRGSSNPSEERLSFMPCWPQHGGSLRKGWTCRHAQEKNSAAPARDINTFFKSQLGHFSKPITTSVLGRLKSNRWRVIQRLRLLDFTRGINIPVTSARWIAAKCTHCFAGCFVSAGSVFTSVGFFGVCDFFVCLVGCFSVLFLSMEIQRKPRWFLEEAMNPDQRTDDQRDVSRKKKGEILGSCKKLRKNCLWNICKEGSVTVTS